MLAESRKRRKNPIHSISLSAPNHWTNDDSKFGQKMLEKMGWSKGLGLGKNNQGISENIKVLHKVTPTGLGFVAHNADDWFKAGDDYARLLAQLTQNIDDEHVTSDCKHDVASKKSLMENSLNSRSRVHYHKFTRGKDLTKYKSEELACILGKGIKDTEPSTSLNMNDYFKTKRKSKNLNPSENETYVVDETTSPDMVTEEENDEDESQNVISKRKKLKSKSTGENEVEILDTNEQDSPFGKKRKLEQTLDQNTNELVLEESNSKAERRKKKKNSKKNKKLIPSNDDFIDSKIQTDKTSDNHDLSSSNKSELEKSLDSDVDEMITLDTSNLKSDSKKKKKSSKKINGIVNQEHQNQIVIKNETNASLEESDQLSKKKSKCITDCELNPSEKKLEENAQVINKKKKSKSKVKDEVHSENETNLSDKNDDKVKNTEIKSEDSCCNNIVSEKNVEPVLENTDLTHKYQTLVDLIVENSSAGKKYCKGETPAQFEEQIKEFIGSVKKDPKTTVAPTHVATPEATKPSIDDSVSDSKSTNLNPDDENFIQEFEVQKNKMLSDKAKHQGVSKFVNDKTMFVAKHGRLLFFGSNLNDIKGYGEF
ncbi:PIN2/TERF1-interacting telomerase inhibitor 1-like [Adelges cooleyi]|uniref:PIN2/TERF1-interacting telomerase inhibitor 1-like n=1 Tax=Adelges cooleyi TaxID=133065 RepID=UPI00217FA679|nr:PIN2/TERF1-interacting telomerase inhibitor 1-like [Adelges cooleyi]